MSPDGSSVLVAIKTLKENATAKTRQDFHREVELMTDLRHPNIVCLLGVVMKEEPMCMLFEHMSQVCTSLSSEPSLEKKNIKYIFSFFFIIFFSFFLSSFCFLFYHRWYQQRYVLYKSTFSHRVICMSSWFLIPHGRMSPHLVTMACPRLYLNSQICLSLQLRLLQVRLCSSIVSEFM